MIYISGKITGTDDYIKRFEVAENRLIKANGIFVINPAAINERLPKCCEYSDYMKVSLCLLSLCDTIYMLKGWETSAGARLEHDYAVANDYIIIYE